MGQKWKILESRSLAIRSLHKAFWDDRRRSSQNTSASRPPRASVAELVDCANPFALSLVQFATDAKATTRSRFKPRITGRIRISYSVRSPMLYMHIAKCQVAAPAMAGAGVIISWIKIAIIGRVASLRLGRCFFKKHQGRRRRVHRRHADSVVQADR